MIAPYVAKDPTKFCSYEDHQRAVDTLEQVCLLRAQSVRGQLGGRYRLPSKANGNNRMPVWTPHLSSWPT